MAGSRVRPVKELRGFKKVSLSAGETEKVSFDITEDMLFFYTINNCWDSEDGKFTVYIGTDSATLNGAEFELKKQ
jgi:beta-glucosidase